MQRLMSRRRAHGSGGLVFHVLNRGVRRLRLFERPEDYWLFLRVFAETQRDLPIRCLSYCLMPNHFHLVLWPLQDLELSTFMLRLTTKHSKRWHIWKGTTGTGHVYQDRYKALPVATDLHFLRLCRYVERNPVRAGLVSDARLWPWSSLAQRAGRDYPIQLTEWPVAMPADWNRFVNEETADIQEIRECIRRRVPFGSEEWRNQVAGTLDLVATPKKRGRKRKTGVDDWRPKSIPGINLN